MKIVAAILTLALGATGFASISAKNPPAGPAFKVHGRLSIYCGNPACRIWIVGTKRILGVTESDPPEVPFMPSKLSALLTTENVIFGDFTVVPLTIEEDGVMRMVRVIAAENLVITDGQLHFIRRIQEKIDEVPNKSPEATPGSRPPLPPSPASGAPQR